MALQAKYSYERTRERRPVPGEEEVRKLTEEPEIRLIALGPGRYRAMDLDDAQLREVEDEIRKARMFEVLTVTSSMRRIELDEQRRRLAEEQQREAERQQQRVVTASMLRQKALAALQMEAEAIRAQRDETLAADRRAVLQREKERLLDRRRAFEASQAEATSQPRARTPARSSSAAAAAGGLGTPGGQLPPVLVMTVALGDGKEDKLIVRQNDDPKRVAVTFARKHRLPDHAVHTLQQQIRNNLAASAQRRTPTPSGSRAASHAREASQQQPYGGGANHHYFHGDQQYRQSAAAAAPRLSGSPAPSSRAASAAPQRALFGTPR